MQGPASPQDPAVLEASCPPAYRTAYLDDLKDFLRDQHKKTISKPRLEVEEPQSKTRLGKLKVLEKELSAVEKLPAISLEEYKRSILERQSKKSAQAGPSNRKKEDDSLLIVNNPDTLEGFFESVGQKNPEALTSKL
jgi:hypothetical protein